MSAGSPGFDGKVNVRVMHIDLSDDGVLICRSFAEVRYSQQCGVTHFGEVDERL